MQQRSYLEQTVAMHGLCIRGNRGSGRPTSHDGAAIRLPQLCNRVTLFSSMAFAQRKDKIPLGNNAMQDVTAQMALVGCSGHALLSVRCTNNKLSGAAGGERGRS